MSNFEIGTEIQYKLDGKWLSGKIHAVKKIDGKRGPVVHSYLIDTGKTHLEGEIVTDTDEPNETYSQPVQIEVAPKDIKQAE